MDLEMQLKAARKVIHTGMMPSDPAPVHVPLDKALEHYDNVVEKIREIAAEKERRTAIRDQIDRLLRQFQGIEMQVAYKRDIERKPLQVIADELGYSYSHISKISSRIRKVR